MIFRLPWVGQGLFVDTPEEIKKAYHEAFELAIKSKYITDLAETKGFTILGLHNEESAKIAKELDSIFAWTVWDAGLAQKSPEVYGIPRIG